MKSFLAALCMMLLQSNIVQSKTAPSYYAVLNSLTHKCFITDRLPKSDTRNITLATDAVYKSKAEAEAGLKSLKPCN